VLQYTQKGAEELSAFENQIPGHLILLQDKSRQDNGAYTSADTV
jgi:hypothetical protein